MIKSLGKYISGYLVTFMAFTVALVIINTLFLGGSFYNIIKQNYGATSPQNMLDQIEALSSSNRIEESGINKLQQNNIWAMFLDSNGNVAWSVDLPDKIPMHYTLQDVAVFSKGYIADFPVFIRNIDSGILVLGYPSDSYTKLTSNYYSMKAINRLPYTISILVVIDFILLFIIYYFSKRKIVKNTEPLITALETLSTGKTVFLSSVHGELSQIADSINKASNILSKQNIARANWICGVSHDIRTPLSMIMGYAAKLENSDSLDSTTRKTAAIIKKQSEKIKDLVQDLNLVSQLDYEMQPLNKENIRIAKLIRTYIVDLLNAGIEDMYTINIKIYPSAENIRCSCDSRLISRAISNLVQNSIIHNPQGCDITLFLEYAKPFIILTVSDNGVGISPVKLNEFNNRPHYLNSTDERLDLRHGLGLLLVKEIVEAHDGTMLIESKVSQGVSITLKLYESPL